MLTQLIPLAEKSFSSGPVAATQLVQWLSLEVSLVNPRTKVTRLTIENASMRDTRDQLTHVEAEITKLQEELRLSREDVGKITKERDNVVVIVGEWDWELGIQKDMNLKLAENKKGLQAEITRLTEVAAAIATRVEGILN